MIIPHGGSSHGDNDDNTRQTIDIASESLDQNHILICCR